jgi:hypothetical protein
MQPHENAQSFAPPLLRQVPGAARGFERVISRPKPPISPGIFQPLPSRAGNAVLSIQEALKNDRVTPYLLDDSVTLQQRTDLSLLHSQGEQLQATNASSWFMDGGALDKSNVAGSKVQPARGDSDNSSTENDDDYDFFKSCHADPPVSSLGSLVMSANESQASSAATFVALRSWIRHFTPRELVSVDAACSIFSPGYNWPGNVDLKKIELDCQPGRQPVNAQLTLTSRVLRAEAEKSFALSHSQQILNLNPFVAAKTSIQDQGSTRPSPRVSQAVSRQTVQISSQRTKHATPTTESSDHATKSTIESSASKRSRGSRNYKQPELARPAPSLGIQLGTRASLPSHPVFAGSTCHVEPDYAAARPVVDVHVPSFCECGAAVVGVWYNKKPYYCQWFRHNRYAALRKLLEQNRCKSKCTSDRSRVAELFTTVNVPSIGAAVRESDSFTSREIDSLALSAVNVEMPQPDPKRVALATGSGESPGEGASARKCLPVPTINPALVESTKVASSSGLLGAVLNDNERVDTLDSQSTGSCQVHLAPSPSFSYLLFFVLE